MNILFTYNNYPEEQHGGVERVTHILMKGLESLGYTCFFLLCKSGQIRQTKIFFKGKRVKNLKRFIIEKGIKVIINQNYNADFSKLYKKYKLQCKYISVFHDSPGSLLIGLKQQLGSPQGKFSKRVFNRILLLIYPLYYKYVQAKYNEDIRYNFNISDKYILLSTKFKDSLCQELGIIDSTKITAISNPLSFDTYYPENQLFQKKKIVLVVARLEESQKRISVIIKIWEEFCKQYPQSQNWILKIVGDGPDRISYKKIVTEKGINNIIFTGKQNPIPYYFESSIFLMTSSHEGWGLTLTEAMQCGVVPIAYNSYLSITDIIKDHENGILISDNDIESFTNSLITLCKDEFYRFKLAKNAIHYSKKFSKENVINKWRTLIETIVHE